MVSHVVHRICSVVDEEDYYEQSDGAAAGDHCQGTGFATDHSLFGDSSSSSSSQGNRKYERILFW